MWFSLSGQTAYFLWSIALGAAAGAAYDLVCASRGLLRAGKIHTLISDILFFVLCGILTSLFALPFNKGSVRMFIVFGEAVGFFCWRATLGRFTGRFYSILSKGLVWIAKKICELLKKIFDLVLKITSFVVYNVNVLIDRMRQVLSAVRKKQKLKKQNSKTVRKKQRPGIVGAAEVRRGGHSQKKRKAYEKRHQKEKTRPCKRKRHG